MMIRSFPSSPMASTRSMIGWDFAREGANMNRTKSNSPVLPDEGVSRITMVVERILLILLLLQFDMV
jgi:hypothetical protein